MAAQSSSTLEGRMGLHRPSAGVEFTPPVGWPNSWGGPRFTWTNRSRLDPQESEFPAGSSAALPDAIMNSTDLVQIRRDGSDWTDPLR